jgi:hypothetical protein
MNPSDLTRSCESKGTVEDNEIMCESKGTVEGNEIM